MKKIHFFEGTEINDLQSKINDWLVLHQDIDIIATNITSLLSANLLQEERERYVFYIFYSSTTMEQEVVTAAAEEELMRNREEFNN